MKVFKKADKFLLIAGAVAASGVSAQTSQVESATTLIEELVVRAIDPRCAYFRQCRH